MASKAVEDAISAFLETEWAALHPTVPVLVENEQQEAPEDGSPFLILQFPVSNVRRLPISDRHYEETGGFRIVINLARGTGTGLMREYGEQLAVMFRGVWVGSVQCLAATEPFTDDRSDEGNYFTGAMTVDFRRTFAG